MKCMWSEKWTEGPGLRKRPVPLPTELFVKNFLNENRFSPFGFSNIRWTICWCRALDRRWPVINHNWDDRPIGPKNSMFMNIYFVEGWMRNGWIFKNDQRISCWFHTLENIQGYSVEIFVDVLNKLELLVKKKNLFVLRIIRLFGNRLCFVVPTNSIK